MSFELGQDALRSEREGSSPSAPRVALPAVRGDRVALVLIAYGILVRLLAFAANRSLRYDEVQIALNIVDRPFAAMLHSLEGMQSAPLGFLMAEKAITSLLGSSELALRLFPLVAGIISVIALWFLARRLLPTFAARLTLLLFAAGEDAVLFASDAKQYSSDAMFSIILMLLALKPRFVPLLVAGCTAIFFSHPACFVLAALGAVLVWRRANLKGIAVLAAAWLTVFALCYRSSLAMADVAGLREFWRGAFWPFPPRGTEDWVWLGDSFVRLFRDPVCILPAAAAAVLCLIGAMSWWRGRRHDLVLLLLPLMLALVASAFELYPFHDRFLVFAVPSLLMMVAAGVLACAAWTERRWPRAAPVVKVLVTLLVVWYPLLSSLQYALEPRASDKEWRRALEHVRAEWRAPDRVFLDEPWAPELRYYALRLGLDLRSYQAVPPLDELERLAQADRGRAGRAWFLFLFTPDRRSTVLWLRRPRESRAERALIARYRERLDELGVCESTFEAPGAWVYRYRFDTPGPSDRASRSARSNEQSGG